MNYYNEHDLKAAAWLRELIKQGHIPDGVVDESDIQNIKPESLKNYVQCHFFAGIGGWSHALKLSGWPADRPVWTGSCPCQPFSSAGKGKAQSDERHLWPVFFNLIKEFRPVTVFGEQVASAIGHGWLDGVSADLEREGYACGAVVLGAHSVGAPHIRQRLYWVADATSFRCDERREAEGAPLQGQCPDGARQHAQSEHAGELSGRIGGLCGSGGLANPSMPRCYQTGIRSDLREERSGQCLSGHDCGAGGMGDTNGSGSQGRVKHCGNGQTWEVLGQLTVGSSGAWGNYDLIPCRDGKSRRIESGTFPLAHGIPGRVGLLRGYGNAIVPQTAQAFIESYLNL